MCSKVCQRPPPIGRPGRSAHAAEEVDVLPEGQAGVLHARAQLRVQRGARRVRPGGGGLAQHAHLRRLHIPVVSRVIFMIFIIITIIFLLRLLPLMFY